jgi:L-amino acid N-acyltransferase YncA
MPSLPKATVRPATPADIPLITEINAYYILNTVITFKAEATTSEAHLENLRSIHAQKHPYLVAISPHTTTSVPEPSGEITSTAAGDDSTSDSNVIGYTYVTGFRGGKAAYIHTVELSLFVHPSHLYGGTGTLLLNSLISILSNPAEHLEYYPNGIRDEDQKVRHVIACMAVNVDSKENGLGLKKWYEGFGFVFSGHLKEVGFKFGKWYVLSSTPFSACLSFRYT